jgi:hypothetical protein
MAQLTPAEVQRMIGSIEDHEIAEIIGTGATAADLADAISCLAGGTYIAGVGAATLTPAGERVLQILRDLQREEETTERER